MSSADPSKASSTEPTIAFIGAGNMASSIIGGLINSGFPANNVFASDPNQNNLDRLSDQYKINTSSDNNTAVATADVILLAVKPQLMQVVCEPLRANLPKNSVVISIAAGITCANLESWLETDQALVRCMPNTPAQVALGASGLYANSMVSEEQKKQTESIISAVGITRWVATEDLIDTVTAISGSSPAYFFLFIESMVDAAVAQGMDKQCATDLAIQSALGAAKLAQTSDDDIVELRKKVTSPNGTTERAIQTLEEQNIRHTVASAMSACVQRAKELAS